MLNQEELEVSIVIPVHNEEKILLSSLADLRDELQGTGKRYEIVVAENGSRDGTREMAAKASERHPEIRVFSIAAPNYGAALREGILRARGEYVVCEEIDILNADFHSRSLDLLRTHGIDMVVGSKSMPGANDSRPLLRRAATRVFNRLLALVVGFKGTDTHGVKSFRRLTVLPVVQACVIDKDVFASELVIRAERAGLRIVEIPVDSIEKRATPIHLLRRVPHALASIFRIVVHVRFEGSRQHHFDVEAEKRHRRH